MNHSILPQKQKIWLTLTEAADLLGVHFTTLRRWADSGQIESFRTPGGRRRFTTAAIARFLHDHQQNPTANLPTVIENSLVNQTRQDLQSKSASSSPWLVRFDETRRTQFRETGSKMTALLLQYSNRTEGGDAYLEEGRRLSAGYATWCHQAGLPAAQAVQAFLFFQRSMLDAIHQSGFVGDTGDNKDLVLYQRASYFFDELLLALVNQYFLLSNSKI